MSCLAEERRMLRSFSSARPRMKNVLNWLSSSSSSSFGCWVTAHSPTPNLRPFAGQPGKDVGLPVLARPQHPLGLLQGDATPPACGRGGRGRRGRPPATSRGPGGPGTTRPAPPRSSRARSRRPGPPCRPAGRRRSAAPDRHGRIGGDAAQVDDAPGPAVHHLQGVERHPGGQLDVAEAGQVLDPGEVGQPGQARRRRSGAPARRGPPPGAGSTRRRCAGRRRSARPG